VERMGTVRSCGIGANRGRRWWWGSPQPHRMLVVLNMGMASMTTWSWTPTARLLSPATLSNGNDDKSAESADDPDGYCCRSTSALHV